tara:strand:+ start:42 stop:1316 length:1275 start_codon:yes stop_codon:yes gene_type:complete
MKKILPFVFIVTYFFAFLIKEWNFSILAYDRLYPQILFISIINLLSLFYVSYNNAFSKLISNSLKNKLILSYLTFLGFCLISFISAENIPESIAIFSYYLTCFFTFIFIYYFSLLIGKHFINYLFILIATASFIESTSVIYSAIDVRFFQSMAVERTLDIRGFAANINISAFSIVIKLPVLMYMLYKFDSQKLKYLSIVLLFTSFSALFLLLSRGAFVAMILIVLLFILINANKAYLHKLVVLLSIIAISGYSVQKILLTQNENQIIDRISAISINRTDDSINERLGYYGHALQSIKKNPLIGIGVGNWKMKSIDYAGKTMTAYTVPYHAHNDLLQIGAEIGLPGLFFYVFLMAYPFLVCVKRIVRKEYTANELIIFLMLSTYIIDSMLNFPVSRPITHVLFLFILVLFSHLHDKINIKQYEKN